MAAVLRAIEVKYRTLRNHRDLNVHASCHRSWVEHALVLRVRVSCFFWEGLPSKYILFLESTGLFALRPIDVYMEAQDIISYVLPVVLSAMALPWSLGY